MEPRTNIPTQREGIRGSIRPLLLVLFFMLYMLPQKSAAQSYAIPRSVLGSGGIAMSGAANRIAGTLGQTGIGIVQNTSNKTMLGFWYTKNAAVAAVATASAAQDFHLGQTYPNPLMLSSQHSAALEYTVGMSLDIDLSVYDQMGRKIATLLHGLQTPGMYTAHFSPDAAVSSGIYHVVMKTTKAGGIVNAQSRLLVLIR